MDDKQQMLDAIKDISDNALTAAEAMSKLHNDLQDLMLILSNTTELDNSALQDLQKRIELLEEENKILKQDVEGARKDLEQSQIDLQKQKDKAIITKDNHNKLGRPLKTTLEDDWNIIKLLKNRVHVSAIASSYKITPRTVDNIRNSFNFCGTVANISYEALCKVDPSLMNAHSYFIYIIKAASYDTAKRYYNYTDSEEQDYNDVCHHMHIWFTVALDINLDLTKKKYGIEDSFDAAVKHVRDNVLDAALPDLLPQIIDLRYQQTEKPVEAQLQQTEAAYTNQQYQQYQQDQQEFDNYNNQQGYLEYPDSLL